MARPVKPFADGFSQAGVAAVDQINQHARRFLRMPSHVSAAAKFRATVRRFCLLPMLLAGKTLNLALGNAAVVDPNQTVKVTRDVVAQTMEQVEALLQDEHALRSVPFGVA